MHSIDPGSFQTRQQHWYTLVVSRVHRSMHEETDEGQTFGECPTNDHDDNLDDRNDPTCRAACQENDHSEEDVLKVEREPKKEWVSSGMVCGCGIGTSCRLFFTWCGGKSVESFAVHPFQCTNRKPSLWSGGVFNRTAVDRCNGLGTIETFLGQILHDLVLCLQDAGVVWLDPIVHF